jgi:hypothetical protein
VLVEDAAEPVSSAYGQVRDSENRRSKYETALEACREAGDPRGQAAVLHSSADHHLMRGDIGEAARQAEEAAGCSTRRETSAAGRSC